MTTASRNDRLASFGFIVRIERMELGFSEISGLPTGTSIIQYRAAAQEPQMRRIPGRAKFTNINLKRGYTPNGRDLWNWRKSVLDGQTQRKSGTITVLEGRAPALVWQFREAWPSKWSGPAMNATSNDVAIEEMEITVEGLALQA